jgi:hypothetical protein
VRLPRRPGVILVFGADWLELGGVSSNSGRIAEVESLPMLGDGDSGSLGALVPWSLEMCEAQV